MSKQPEPPSTQSVTVEDLIGALKNTKAIALTYRDSLDALEGMEYWNIQSIVRQIEESLKIITISQIDK